MYRYMCDSLHRKMSLNAAWSRCVIATFEDLLENEELCDVRVRTRCGDLLSFHSFVLASGASYL